MAKSIDGQKKLDEKEYEFVDGERDALAAAPQVDDDPVEVEEEEAVPANSKGKGKAKAKRAMSPTPPPPAPKMVKVVKKGACPVDSVFPYKRESAFLVPLSLANALQAAARYGPRLRRPRLLSSLRRDAQSD